MSQYTEAIQKIQEGVLLVVDNKLSQASYDKTIRGRITEIVSDTKYKVMINGVEYIVSSTSVHAINDTVNIIVPQNNMNDMFIIPEGITAKSTLPANGGNADTVNYHTVESDVPINAVFTDTTYLNATETSDGLMSKDDKTKLNNIAEVIKNTVLTGLSTATNAVISATDTVLIALGKLQKQITDNLNTLTNHTSNTSNPHSVTKSQVGLSEVENKSSDTIRSEITSQNVTNALGYTPINSSERGTANGVAELDTNGKVPSSQLPSYVDDVLEGTYVSSTIFNDLNGTAYTGETGKIYVDTTSEKTYRWSGSIFTVISESLALGETSSTAYCGDKGKIAYDHSQLTSGNPHNVTASDVGLENVDNTSDINKPISTATQIALDIKAPLDSPSLTGTPTAPTATTGTNTTQVATTAFVQQEISNVNIGGSENSLPSPLLITQQDTANEGGELRLEKSTNGTLSGDVGIDNYVNDFRIFENGGNARGAYIDLTTCSNGVGSKIWHSDNDGAGSGLDADTAYNISNTGTVTLGTATESNSITISQPSYSTDKPVKLFNFDWYGNTWSLGNIRSGSTASNGLGVYLKGVEKARFTDGNLLVNSKPIVPQYGTTIPTSLAEGQVYYVYEA